MIGTRGVKDHPALTYPIKWSTKDDLDLILIKDSSELDAFYLTAMGTMRVLLDEGTAIKSEIRSAKDEAGVNSVIDKR